MLTFVAQKSGLSRSSIIISVSLHAAIALCLLGFSNYQQSPLVEVSHAEEEVFEIAFEPLPAAPLQQIETSSPQPAHTEPKNIENSAPSKKAIKPQVEQSTKKDFISTQKTAATNVSNNNLISTNTTVGEQNNSTNSPSHNHISNLSSWINRHKFYPAEARRKGEEGTVLVRISLLDNGDLLSFQVVRSSGSQALDRAATEILKRSSPYPQEFAQQTSHVEVPLVFSLES